MSALNGLNGFNITDVKLNITARAGEPNLQGFAYIPNPSNLTVALVQKHPSILEKYTDCYIGECNSLTLDTNLRSCR